MIKDDYILIFKTRAKGWHYGMNLRTFKLGNFPSNYSYELKKVVPENN